MLKTILDYSIFKDFTENQPKPVPEGNKEENKLWSSFWEFLKEGTDLSIINIDKIDLKYSFIKDLPRNRNGTKFNYINNFTPQKTNKFPDTTDVQTVFFIDEADEDKQNGYREKNGFIFGFINDYMNVWSKLSLFNKSKILSVEDVDSLQFNAWTDLAPYLNPFTDLIIADNYILDEELWNANLMEIIKQFNNVASIKFNLLIISNIKGIRLIGGKRDEKDLLKRVESKLNVLLEEENVNCNLNIVLTKYSKRHDRVIYSNYLRISSGDSFNYFRLNGDFVTKGTEISFYSLTKHDNYKATKNSLAKINRIINTLKENHDWEEYLTSKDIKNGLLKLD